MWQIMNWLWETDGLSRKEYEGSKGVDGTCGGDDEAVEVLRGR